MMKNVGFYKVAALALLVLNLGLAAYCFFLRPGPPRPGGAEGFRGKVKEILHLDDAQEREFIALAEAHNEQMRTAREEQSRLLKSYFGQLTAGSAVADHDSVLLEVLAVDRGRIEFTYAHFQDVRNLLRPDQAAYFKEFMAQALEKLLLDKKGPPRPEHR